MARYQNYIDFLYVLIVGFVFSATLILGAIVAPVVFHSSDFISAVELTRFQNGELMSEIFRRFGIVLNICILIVVAIEAMQYKKFLSSGVYIIAFSLFVIASLLFSLYFTPIILGLLAQGENVITSNQAAFDTLHKLSEYDFIVIMGASLYMLFVKLIPNKFQ